MSDIGLMNVGGLLGALATFALGLFGFLLATMVAIGERRPRLGRRIVAYGAGPLACAAVGGAGWLLLTLGSARDSAPRMFVFPAVGVGMAVVVAVVVHRRRPR
jgi:cytochrome bd-type quinol oxidase subunit 2